MKGRRHIAESKMKTMIKKAEIQRDTVENIRKYHQTGMKRKELVEKFGVSGSVISNIVHFHTYCYE
jgi:uncharacterized protein YjcR